MDFIHHNGVIGTAPPEWMAAPKSRPKPYTVTTKKSPAPPTLTLPLHQLLAVASDPWTVPPFGPIPVSVRSSPIKRTAPVQAKAATQFAK